MKKILIVDNEAANLDRISEEFKQYSEFQILTAKEVKRAAGLIKIIKIDLVLTELNLPGISGLRFLNYLKKHHAEIPAMAMSAPCGVGIQSKLSHLNIKKWFQKPIDIEILTEAFFNELDIVAAGRIHGISLASFLQLVDLEKKTCTLLVKTKDKSGVIYCLNGEVIAAETAALKGKKALYHILFWKNSIIEIKEDCQKISRQIRIPLMHLLMESHHLKDEADEKLPGASEPFFDDQKKGGNPVPADNKNTGLSFLSNKLSAISDVEAFVIFSENNVIRAKSDRFTVPEGLLPSAFFNMGSHLEVAGGSLECMDININGSKRLALLQHPPYLIVVDLKPGCRAADCLARLRS